MNYNVYSQALNARIDRMGPPPSTFGGNPFCGGNFISSPRLGSFMAASLFSMPNLSMGYCNPFAFCNPFLMSAMNFGFGSYTMPTFTMPAYQMPTFSIPQLPAPTFTYTPINFPVFPTFTTSNVKAASISSEKQGAVDTAKNIKGKYLKKDKSQYGPEFLAKVKEIAKRLNCDYRDLLGVMNSESGINAQQWCKVPGYENTAVGLIQFTKAAATSLGTTLEALSKMTPVQQLDYVEKYYQMWIKTKNLTGKKLSGADLYTLTYTPAYINKEVLSVKGHEFYNANRGLDFNKDGKITKSDLAQQVQSKYVSDNTFLA